MGAKLAADVTSKQYDIVAIECEPMCTLNVSAGTHPPCIFITPPLISALHHGV